jgi:hypothetical protein
MASHANGEISPIHSFATHAKCLHLKSLPQRWNHHQLVLLQPSHQWWGFKNEKKPPTMVVKSFCHT